MCLLTVLFQVHPEWPLVVAANRDEWLARPASSVEILRQTPRTLGGRDQVAQGTWLAVNEHGVVAALTNQPTQGEPDARKRSRGELPLQLTEHASAAAAAEAFQASVRCDDYNPCWLLVGDRGRLFYLAVEGQGPPALEPLEPGAFVLENRPLLPRSGKASRVETRLVAAPGWSGEALLEGLRGVLASHDRPDHGDDRPAELESACVHAGIYGTRSASLVRVPPEGRPRLHAADGPLCQTEFTDRSGLWT